MILPFPGHIGNVLPVFQLGIEISRNRILKFLDKRSKKHLRIIAFLGFQLLNEISFQSHSFKLSQETEIIFVVENLSLAIKNLKINTYLINI